MRDFERRSAALQHGLQRRHGTQLGLCQPHRGRIPLHGGPLKELAEPKMVLLAEVDGYPVGFSITLPDMNEAVRPLNGRLFPYGLPINFVRFLWRRRHIKTARMIVLDVLEKYRRRGIAEMLILKTLDYGKNVAHYTGAELGWTLEDNYLVNQTIEAVGGKKYKVYRIYEKSIGG